MSTINDASYVVLGSSITALAVARRLSSRTNTTTIVDTTRGIAFESKVCHKLYLQPIGSRDEQSLHLDAILKLASPSKATYLIGTSDSWLNFIIRHRKELSHKFEVLHAPNHSLETCLNKINFYKWCEREGIRVPRTLSPTNQESINRLEEIIPPPIMIKLANRHELGIRFPKTKELRTAEDIENFKASEAVKSFSGHFLISESLLNRPLIQYSVPFCRNSDGNTLAYAAIKERPLPKECRVGTFISGTYQPEAIAICKEIADKLDYFGIGELEILYDQDARRHYVIELNARPWEQFSHHLALGFDFFNFLFNEGRPENPNRDISGLAWTSLYDDFYYFRRSSRSRAGQPLYETWRYLYSLFRTRSFAYFSLKDPRPAIAKAKELLRLKLTR